MGDDLAGRVALVTGAGSGIGRASANAFAAAGASVAIVDVDGDSAEAAARGLPLVAGAGALALRCDVSDEEAVAATVAAVVDRFGRLDFAHNNAGISPVTGDTAVCDKALWDAVLAVNLTGVFLGMKHEIPAILPTGGAIVNTASGSAFKTTKNMPAYIASKHGVVGVTKAAAYEYADRGIRINAVAPGATRTWMVESKVAQGAYTEEQMSAQCPMTRLAEPAEIAAAVVWLCTPAASFVNGAVLPVDGGTIIT